MHDTRQERQVQVIAFRKWLEHPALVRPEGWQVVGLLALIVLIVAWFQVPWGRRR